MMLRLFVRKKVIIKNKTEWKNAMKNIMRLHWMGYDNLRSDLMNYLSYKSKFQ